MFNWISALQFLTIIHIRKTEFDEEKLSNSVIYFPLIGMILGLILVIANIVLSPVFPDIVTSTILVGLLAILTGGLHLDGLADTFDAIGTLGSGKNKEEMLKIMRDSSSGSFGVISLILIIVTKIAMLASFDSRNQVLLAMLVLGRWSMVLPMFLFKYAHAKEGKAKIFIEEMKLRKFILATLFTLIIIFLVLKLKGINLFLVTGFISLIISKFFSNKIGGITGDTLGAINEISEVFTLIILYILL